LFYPFLVNGFSFSVKYQNMLAIPARRTIAFPCETLSIYLLGSKNLKIKLPPAATTTDCDRWDRSNSSKKIPAVPPGLAHILKTRPLIAYIHTPAFGNGEPLLRLAYSAFAFPLALRSPFGIAMFCRDFTARGSLKEQNQSLLTLPQRFCAL